MTGRFNPTSVHQRQQHHESFTRPELDQFADDLREIQRVARRKRVLGSPDPLLELGVQVLEDRLARMRREALR
jgi:hypothetical protein